MGSLATLIGAAAAFRLSGERRALSRTTVASFSENPRAPASSAARRIRPGIGLCQVLRRGELPEDVQMKLRRTDGWQKIASVLSQQAAA